jgi:hypothetical protein
LSKTSSNLVTCLSSSLSPTLTTARENSFTNEKNIRDSFDSTTYDAFSLSNGHHDQCDVAVKSELTDWNCDPTDIGRFVATLVHDEDNNHDDDDDDVFRAQQIPTDCIMSHTNDCLKFEPQTSFLTNFDLDNNDDYGDGHYNEDNLYNNNRASHQSLFQNGDDDLNRISNILGKTNLASFGTPSPIEENLNNNRHHYVADQVNEEAKFTQPADSYGTNNNNHLFVRDEAEDMDCHYHHHQQQQQHQQRSATGAFLNGKENLPQNETVSQVNEIGNEGEDEDDDDDGDNDDDDDDDDYDGQTHITTLHEFG